MESEVLADLELRRYLRGLLRRKWMIAAIAALAVGVSVGVSALQTPRYVGTAQIVLQPTSSASLFNQAAPTQVDPQVRVDTEIQVIQSAPVRASVVSTLGAVPKVAAGRVGQTLVIEVKGQAASARRAADVANAYATAYLDLSKKHEANNLLAAARQIQDQITRLQSQIDQLAASSAGAGASHQAETAASRAPLESQRDVFVQRLSELQVDASLASGGAALVASAMPPSVPVQPRPVRLAVLALLVGLVVSVGAACALEYLDDRIRTDLDLERASGLPVLAGIPSFGRGQGKGDVPTLALEAGRNTAAAEAYRALRTSVQLLGVVKPLTVIQFTSPTPGDGKTTTVSNLAAAVADTGRRVVIVDCDLRRPRLHQVFGVTNEVGLTTVLSGETTVVEAVQPVPGFDGLFVLTSGAVAPNPSELLSLSRTSEMIFALQSDFDMVLIDSPPVLPVTDAVVLSEWVDAVVLLATSGTTSRRVVARTVQWLTQAGAPLVGVVLNRAVPEAPYQYGYNYDMDRQHRRGKAPASLVARTPADIASEPSPPSGQRQQHTVVENPGGNGQGNGITAGVVGPQAQSKSRQ